MPLRLKETDATVNAIASQRCRSRPVEAQYQLYMG